MREKQLAAVRPEFFEIGCVCVEPRSQRVIDHVHLMIKVECQRVEIVTEHPGTKVPRQRRERRGVATIALTPSRSSRINALTCARVDRPFVELSRRCDLRRRQAGGPVGRRARALQRGRIPMAVPRIRKKIVRPQTAIFAGALCWQAPSYAGASWASTNK
jgi:hypothetical protein